MASQDAVFDLSGHVQDQNGVPVPGHGMKAIIDYWQFVNGVSGKYEQTVFFPTDANSNYAHAFPGPGSPLLGWDNSKTFVVTVGNTNLGWKTDTAGQNDAQPSGNSPIPVPISDTVIEKLNPNPGGG